MEEKRKNKKFCSFSEDTHRLMVYDLPIWVPASHLLVSSDRMTGLKQPQPSGTSLFCKAVAG